MTMTVLIVIVAETVMKLKFVVCFCSMLIIPNVNDSSPWLADSFSPTCHLFHTHFLLNFISHNFFLITCRDIITVDASK